LARRAQKAKAAQVPPIGSAGAPQLPTAIPAAIAQQLAQISARGPTRPVAIKRAKQEWSDFELGDGSLLRVRPSVDNVLHEIGKFNASGQPIYHFNIGLNVTVVAPKHLLQGYKKSKPRSTKRKKKK
jgi:hypothetical protein